MIESKYRLIIPLFFLSYLVGYIQATTTTTEERHQQQEQQTCLVQENNGSSDDIISNVEENRRMEITTMVNNEFPNLIEYDLSFRDGENEFCYNRKGNTKRMHLNQIKTPNMIQYLQYNRDIEKVVKYICTIDVSVITERIILTRNETFNKTLQDETNIQLKLRKKTMDKYKPGVDAVILIFCNHYATEIYHFPWLQHWLPLIKTYILDPLKININSIARMQFALMNIGSTINKHADRGMWVGKTHRVHIPIITHDDIYFITESPIGYNIRIPSKVGAVYEFNNYLLHTVRNYGNNAERIHLIIDWLDQPVENDNIIQLQQPGQVCVYNDNKGIICEQ